MNKKLLSTAILAAMATGISTTASADLAATATLNFDAGVTTVSYSGTAFVKSGSYFGMDVSGNGKVTAAERTAISQNDGLILGTSQAASGSHGGVIDGSESAGFDNPWEFFKNTGMHYSSTPSTVLTATGATATVDFSGWGVTWNGIPAINMGGGTQDCGTTTDGVCINPADSSDIGGIFNNGTGVATITCAVDCAEGDTYTLDYAATVPQGDASNFGGVGYVLHLVGTVGAATAAVPVPAAVWLFGSGLLGLAGVARRRKSA